VGLHARAGLPHAQGKFACVLPGEHLVGGRLDGPRLVTGQQATRQVDGCAGAFDQHQRRHQLGRQLLGGNIKKFKRALGLHAPQALCRHGHFAHASALQALGAWFG